MKSFTESTAIKGSSIEKNINNAVRIDNYHNNFDQLHWSKISLFVSLFSNAGQV